MSETKQEIKETTKVVSLDNLYSGSSDRRQQEETGGADSIASSKFPFVWKLYEMLESVEQSGDFFVWKTSTGQILLGTEELVLYHSTLTRDTTISTNKDKNTRTRFAIL